MIERRYTWSNGQDVPTLERLDRALASTEWFIKFPYHCLRPLSSDCSDHCPLLLLLDSSPGVVRRFWFESFWTKLPGYLEVVELAWSHSLVNADPCRILDFKLRNVARALQSWSATKVGSVRLQLAIAREVVLRLDEAQESRALEQREVELRRGLKVRILGLASLAKNNCEIALQACLHGGGRCKHSLFPPPSLPSEKEKLHLLSPGGRRRGRGSVADGGGRV